jgi:hypothetical protein
VPDRVGPSTLPPNFGISSCATRSAICSCTAKTSSNPLVEAAAPARVPSVACSRRAVTRTRSPQRCTVPSRIHCASSWPRGGEQVLLGAGEAADRTDRSHDEAGGGTDAHDQAVGHAQFENLVAVIRQQRLERQHGQGRRRGHWRCAVVSAAADRHPDDDRDSHHPTRHRGAYREPDRPFRRRQHLRRDRRGLRRGG